MLFWENKYADEKLTRRRTRSLTDCAKKKQKKQENSLANYNKIRINIVHRYGCWVELKEALRVKTHFEL